jgi:hypothetical protein
LYSLTILVFVYDNVKSGSRRISLDSPIFNAGLLLYYITASLVIKYNVVLLAYHYPLVAGHFWCVCLSVHVLLKFFLNDVGNFQLLNLISISIIVSFPTIITSRKATMFYHHKRVNFLNLDYEECMGTLMFVSYQSCFSL